MMRYWFIGGLVLALLIVSAAFAQDDSVTPTIPPPSPTNTITPTLSPDVTPTMTPTSTSTADLLQASFTGDVVTSRIGEPFIVTLVVETPPDYTVTFPEIDERWSGMDFTPQVVDEVTVEEADDLWTHTLTVELVPWFSGEGITPPTVVTVQGLAEGAEPARLRVAPFFFEVVSVLDDDPTLRPARSVVDFFYVPVLALSLGAMVVIVGGAYLVYWGRGQLGRFKGGRVQLSQRDAEDMLLHQLQRIEMDSSDVISQYAAVGDSLRDYVYQRFEVRADEMTTDELMRHLKASGELPEERLRELRYLLQQADYAKFAPMHVFAEPRQPLVELVRRWVGAMKAHRPKQEGA